MTEFVFDEIEDLDVDYVPVHVQDAFLRWLRERPNKVRVLQSVPLEEVPGTARGLSALNKIWCFQNKLNGQRLLLAAFVSNFERADWLKLQLAREEHEPDFVVIVTGKRESQLSEIDQRDLYDTSFTRVEFKAIGNRAFAPTLIDMRVPGADWDGNRGKYSALREAKDFENARDLRRAFWGFVRGKLYTWDTSKDDIGKKERIRAAVAPGLSVGQRVVSGYVTVWIEELPGSKETSELLKSQSIQLCDNLGCKMQPGLLPFCKTLSGSPYGELDFEKAADWLKAEVDRYEAALAELARGKP